MSLESNRIELDEYQKQLVAKFIVVLETASEDLLKECLIDKQKKELLLQEASGNKLTLEQLQIKFGLPKKLRDMAINLPDIKLPDWDLRKAA